MDFYNKRIVKKPRKTYRCELCLKDITGEHYYVSTAQDGVFYYGRQHIECEEIMSGYCSDCDYSSDCESSVEECFYERPRQESEDLGWIIKDAEKHLKQFPQDEAMKLSRDQAVSKRKEIDEYIKGLKRD